ncbi:MAG: penicillin amidase [Thermomicrobiales bacterium]|nr:penicillin amidase [Thermomicrobiales bacterium]
MVDDGLLMAAVRGEQSVNAVCATAGITAAEFEAALDANLRRRLPPAELRLRGGVSAPLEILRDRYGVPHIYAQTTADLYYGLGLAMGQDRLWQMDVFRRRGQGRLAEVLGAGQISADVTHRTLGLDLIAAREADLLDDRTGAVLRAFVAGINRAVEEAGDNPPIEFDLLGYRPEPWRVQDILAAVRAFWWQLNGRLASIVVGEAAQRHLPAGPLRDAFMTPEFGDEPIVPRGEGYPPVDLPPAVPGGHESLLTVPVGTDTSATGSNNWAVGGRRTRSGAGVLGSDPHLPFALPGNWYECRLVGPEDDAVGAAWAGMPGLWFGRNRRIAWGITNNNVSLRDLYAEEVDPDDPDRYRDGETWRPFTERAIEIAVRDRAPERLVVRETVRGPVVNHIVPAVDQTGDPPLSLRWVGQEHVENVKPLLAVNRAGNWAEFRAALADWSIPTFNWVYADVDGHVGYQCASRLPIRGRVTRGFRDANNPEDRWLGYVPFEAMPRRDDLPEGFVATANNAAVANDYPYPFYGAFASGDRALRIRERINEEDVFDAAACRALQQDTYSPYAQRISVALLRRLAGQTDPEVALFVAQIEGWDHRYETAARAPVFFDMFMRVWTARIASERFPAHLAGHVAGQGTVGARLLEADDLTWFAGDKDAIVVESVRQAVREVRERFGTDPAGWAWGNIHIAQFKHPLSNPVLASRFDVGPRGISGGAATVRNTGLGTSPLFGAASGAEYQLVADLGDGQGILANQNLGQSGQPGSPHYGDQFANWIEGRYHAVALDRARVEAEQTASARIEPDGAAGSRQ